MAHAVHTAPRVQLTLSPRYYAVAGGSARALRDAVRTLGPQRGGQRFAAFTEWCVAWELGDVVAAPSGVRSRQVSVRVEATMALPRWDAPRGCDEGLKASWQRYVSALELHERSHVTLAHAAGRGAYAALAALGEHDSRESLARAAEEAAARAVEFVRCYEREFDARTAHGAAQGASLARLG